VEVCKQLGWTYEDYLNAPAWFISTLNVRNDVEGRFLKKQEGDAKRKNKF